MKKFTSIILIICMACIACTCLFASPTVYGKTFSAYLTYDNAEHEYRGTLFSVSVGGKLVDSPIPPLVWEEGRSIVAVREIFEAMDAEVLWIPGSPERVMITYGTNYVSLALNNNIAIVNGRSETMEVPAKLITMDNITKTMVPVRFVAETLNMTVDYDEDSGTISISAPTEPSPAVSVSPSPATSPVLSPTASPTATPLSTPGSAASGKVVDLQYKQAGNTLTTTITLSAPYSAYSPFMLDNPTRLVLDITDFSVALPKDTYPLEYNTYRIRTSNFMGDARIVFDVHNVPEYTIAASEDKKTITITMTAEYTKKAPIVVIDAGHGGVESGAVGFNDDGTIDLIEKNVNLPVALMVIDILKSHGVDVRATRTTDVFVALKDRTNFANALDASLFVSIHSNAYTNTEVNGTLVMHHTSKDTSAYGVSGAKLAQNILDRMIPSLGTKNGGRINGSTMWVIRNANMPSVIVELGFITNKSDRELLKTQEFREKAAQAIAAGIMDTIPDLIR